MKRKAILAIAAMLTTGLASPSSVSGNTAVAEFKPPLNPVVEVIEELETEPTTTTLPPVTTVTTSASTTSLVTTTSETTAQATTTTTVQATEPEEFEFSPELVADVMHDYFAEKGYNDAQIAGIVANADIESGLQPSRSENGYFGLFQLMNCPRQREMLAAFEDAGLGKYTQPEYWPDGASDFDTADDMERFVRLMLDYAMDPNDTRWQTELYNAQSPEEAAEIFLVHYERAVGGEGTIQYYGDYLGCNYQAAEKRRNYARMWYEAFTS